MQNCLFCKIVNQEIATPIIYADANVIAFTDIKPQAPHHTLIIPRKHIATLNDLNAEDMLLAGHLLYTAQQLAKQFNIAKAGYRVVMNCNEAGGQAVYHIHLHLLGGRSLSWPPG